MRARGFLTLWRAVAALHPERVRRRHGAAMESEFLRQLERARPGVPRIAVGVRALGDLLSDVARERAIGIVGGRSASGHRNQGTHTGRGGETMGSLIRDVRVAVRTLAKAPVFTAISAGSIAIGIAAVVAVFSVANTVLFRPLPGIANYDRVVELGRSRDGSGFDTFAYPDFQDIGTEIPALEATAAVSMEMLSISQGAEGLRSIGFAVEPAYFDILGTTPALGRFFTPDEASGYGEHPVVVVSNGYWVDHLGGDPGAIGTTIYLNRRPYTVVGVTDPIFRGHMMGLVPTVWVPFVQVPDLSGGGTGDFENRGASWHLGIGLRSASADLDGLRAQLAGLGERLQEAYPETNRSRSFAAMALGPIPGGGRGGVRLFVTALLGMVSLILLVTCTNVAGMFLARTSAREGEVSVRRALGAGRGRLVQQLTAEPLLVFVLGGGAGLLLASRLVAAIRPDLLPLPVDVDFAVSIDARVVGFAVAATLATVLLFGVLPASRFTRGSLAQSMIGAERGGGGAGRRMRTIFAGTQVGLSLVLLVCAGLFTRSLQRAASLESGFEPEGAWVTYVDLSIEGYGEDEARAFQTDLLSRLRAQPGVRAASLSSDLPLDLSSRGTSVVPEGWSGEGPEGRLGVDFNQVTPGYFETLGIPVLQGRGIQESDGRDAPRVAVVSRGFAAQAWPGEDPVGRTFGLGVRTEEGTVESLPWEVVGVVEDTRNQMVTETPAPFVYFPLAQRWTAGTQVVVRTDAPRAEVVPAFRATLLEADPNLSLSAFSTLERYTSVGILPQRIAAWLTGVLGLLALVLSGLGIYGVISYSVGRRQREIGIRMAMGADRGEVARRFVLSGLKLALPGILIGGAAALGVARVLQSLLLDLSPWDPVALGSVAGLLTAMVLLASWIPARRAAGVDPAVSLRRD